VYVLFPQLETVCEKYCQDGRISCCSALEHLRSGRWDAPAISPLSAMFPFWALFLALSLHYRAVDSCITSQQLTGNLELQRRHDSLGMYAKFSCRVFGIYDLKTDLYPLNYTFISRPSSSLNLSFTFLLFSPSQLNLRQTWLLLSTCSKGPLLRISQHQS
jgi:hypothetical protein